MELVIRPTDLKNWAYCARVVWYHRTMPPEGLPQTYKMGVGVRAQEMVEKLEVRRSLERHGFDGARRVYGHWLRDEELGLRGRVDLALVREDAGDGAVVDYKLTSGAPGENHKMQMLAYAVLVEKGFGVRVRRGFLYRIPDDRMFEIDLGDARTRVASAVEEIRGMVAKEEMPERTSVRQRCQDCEFANFCGDVW